MSVQLGVTHVLRTLLVVTLMATTGPPTQAQGYEQLEKWCHDDNATDDQTIQGCSAVISSGRESGEKLSRVYYDRGTALFNKDQLDPAIEDFDEAIRLDPTDPDTFNNRGNAHNNEKDYDLALKDFDQALKLKPDFAYAFNNRGIVYDNLGQTSRAVEDYDRAIALDPNFGDAFNNRGIANLNLGRPDAALADFDNALRVDPKKASSLFGRGVARRRLGDTAGGDADIAAAKAIRADVTEGMAEAGVRP